MPDSLPYTPALEGRTLLDELNHRIKNELASVINLVTFKQSGRTMSRSRRHWATSSICFIGMPRFTAS